MFKMLGGCNNMINVLHSISGRKTLQTPLFFLNFCCSLVMASTKLSRLPAVLSTANKLLSAEFNVHSACNKLV